MHKHKNCFSHPRPANGDCILRHYSFDKQKARDWNTRPPAEPVGNGLVGAVDDLCEDCPPVGYPTDKTRCGPCPRRSRPTKAQPAEQAVERLRELRSLSDIADVLRDVPDECFRRIAEAKDVASCRSRIAAMLLISGLHVARSALRTDTAPASKGEG